MKTRYVCLNCNSDIRKHLIDKQLSAGFTLEMVKCPECGKEFVAERGPTLKKWQVHCPAWFDESWRVFGTPEAVSVRNFRKLVIGGQLFNGIPLIERGDYVWKWYYNSVRKCWHWVAFVKTRTAFVKNYLFKRTYRLDYWEFGVVAAHKNSEVQQINVALDRREKWKNLNFSAVIAEVKKYGFNVTADFLAEQVAGIRAGFKQNRFLPDRSGQVFSPIHLNGLKFTFTPIAQGDKEYIC